MNLIEIADEVIESNVEKTIIKAIADFSNQSLLWRFGKPIPKVMIIFLIINSIPRISEFYDPLNPMFIMQLLSGNLKIKAFLQQYKCELVSPSHEQHDPLWLRIRDNDYAYFPLKYSIRFRHHVAR